MISFPNNYPRSETNQPIYCGVGGRRKIKGKKHESNKHGTEYRKHGNKETTYGKKQRKLEDTKKRQ
jgi:hypothetical protein